GEPTLRDSSFARLAAQAADVVRGVFRRRGTAAGVTSTPARQAGTLLGRHSHLVSSGKAQCWGEVYRAGPLRLIKAIHWMEEAQCLFPLKHLGGESRSCAPN